jgi:hypothetical protein
MTHFCYGEDIVPVICLGFTVDESLADSLESILSSIPENIDLDELIFFLKNDVIPRLSCQTQL